MRIVSDLSECRYCYSQAKFNKRIGMFICYTCEQLRKHERTCIQCGQHTENQLCPACLLGSDIRTARVSVGLG